MQVKAPTPSPNPDPDPDPNPDQVKALKKPPAGVKLTLKAVAIMFGVKSVKIADPDNPQKKIDDYWGPSSKMLNDLGPDKFKQALIDFDKDNIPESIIKLIDPICDQEDFTPEAIAKVSVACEAMCMWAQAMRTYYYVAKEVEPKKESQTMGDDYQVQRD